ncbi:hypothetical protein [Kitasatospora sp. NPDC057936]|uniref:hypothetical protein n=1 Tax=Kitasatospora sp. NPDC057936 TaxID=3346283 RepID=UPI0036D79031
MRSISKLLVAGAVAGSVAFTGVAAANAATGVPAGSAAVTADDTPPPPAVEDFAYPGADKIFTDRGIKLITGDGHMLLVDCPTPGTTKPGVLQIDTRGMGDRDTIGHGKFCFQITGNSASLKLELPSVYGITTPDYAVTAHMVTGTGDQTVDKTFTLQRNMPNAVGEATEPQRRPYTLLDLTAVK